MPSLSFSARPILLIIHLSAHSSLRLDYERLSIVSFLVPFFFVYFSAMAGWWHPIRTLAALAFGAMGAASLYLVSQLLHKDRPKVKAAPSYYKMPGGHKTMISGWQHPAVAAAANASDDGTSDTQQLLLKPIEEEKVPSSPQPSASPFLPARPAKSQPAVLQPSADSGEQREARLQDALREKATKTQNYSRVHAELLHTERT